MMNVVELGIAIFFAMLPFVLIIIANAISDYAERCNVSEEAFEKISRLEADYCRVSAELHRLRKEVEELRKRIY